MESRKNNKDYARENGNSGKLIREIEIKRLASDGTGIGYIDGKATFVPGMLPGEQGTVTLTENKKNYQKAEIVEIKRFSPEREQPPCPVFLECGGCDLQHMNYEYTLAWKKQWVEDALQRIGGLPDIQAEPVIGMEKPWRYRNKAVLHRDKEGKLGYYREKSKDVILFEDCLLLSPKMNQKISKLRLLLGKSYPEIRTATFRQSNRGKGLLILEGKTGKSREWQSIVKLLKQEEEFSPQGCSVAVPQGKNRFEGSGPQFLNEYIDDIRFRVSPNAFLQVNPVQTKKLYSLILQYAELAGSEEVWDLYCGIGTITLILAKRCRKVVGIEENPHAVEDGIFNAKESGIANASFIQGKVEEKLKSISGSPDIVVTDPPRAGMNPLVIERLLKLKPRKIIYVSCNPATLARDLKLLTAGDGSYPAYAIKKVQPVDMFAWSCHVECVVLITRL